MWYLIPPSTSLSTFPSHMCERRTSLIYPPFQVFRWWTKIFMTTAMCDPTQYRQIIGNLIYLTITRPDLSYSVGLLSRFIQNPHKLHLDCAKRILRYVSATMDYNIWYNSNTTILLEGHTTRTGQATEWTDDPHPDSFSLSVVERYPRAVRSSRQSHCRARKPNTGAQ